MNNPLYIKPQGTIREKAIINVLNILTSNMFEKKVVQVENDNKTNEANISNEVNNRTDSEIEILELITELSDVVGGNV